MTTPDITFYTVGTPNGVKVSIVLEELGIPYKVREISFQKNEQKEPWFLKINPNGKIPAIIDHSRGDFNVFESGAIMIYLCEHYDPEGKLLPKDPNLRSQVIQWIMFQMGGLGPMQGQSSHFNRYAPEKIPYAIKRYSDETKRLYSVLNDSLEGKEYLVGNRYTLADAISYPWVRAHFLSGIPSINEFPNLKTWIARIDERPATQKGLNVPTPDKVKELTDNPEKLEEFTKVAQSAFKFKSVEEEK
ncbi:glutathione S-transferase [Glomus cerebriforme]|uniref:Glutathione S-transferase n=1 Tax=Glomus cerebriforme TaxID=658196 RepID=A0A397TQN3_9GLOM|nr:glutathione S-transferase [Glomus cerebriforme]